jgi:hypothetical protein
MLSCCQEGSIQDDMRKIISTINENPIKSAVIFYGLFFLILFLQFPLKKAISGNCDTWLALTYSTYTLESMKSFFTGEYMGRIMYPVENPLAYGESAPGAQIMIIFFKMFGFSDYWTNYFYISLIFIMTATAIFVFAGNFVSSFFSRLFAGFVFTCNNMTFAHIDDSIIVFFFIAALSLHFLYKWLKERKTPYLITAALLNGIQIYFSFYNFLYLSVMAAIFIIVLSPKNKTAIKELIKPLSVFSVIVLSVALPMVLFYLHTLKGLDFVNPFGSLYTTKKASLNPVSMLLVLPDNLIYPDIGEMMGIPKNWGFIRHYCFTGILSLSMFFYSLGKWNKHRLLFSVIAFAGFFMALGPVFQFNFQDVMYSPLYVFYTFIPILEFLRVTLRAHFIFLFAISVSAAISFERIVKIFPKKALFLIPALFIVHAVENTPFPMISFNAVYTEEVPDIYGKVKEIDKKAVVLDLPSFMKVENNGWSDRIYNDPHNFVRKKEGNPELDVVNIGMFVHSWDDLFEYNREVIYANWQTSHKLNLVNGVNGYFPAPRMMYQHHINNLPQKRSFAILKKWKIDYIVWHDDMIIERDTLKLSDLERSPCLQKIHRSGKKHLFRLKECHE